MKGNAGARCGAHNPRFEISLDTRSHDSPAHGIFLSADLRQNSADCGGAKILAEPYTIRIFVPDGNPEGLRIIDRMNWTGLGIALLRLFCVSPLSPI
jgi:hypothetical protein